MKPMKWITLAIGFIVFSQAAQADWEPVKRLTWNSEDSWNLEPAVDASNNLHVVWIDTMPGNRQVYHKESTDGGATWSTNQRLSWTSSEIYYLGLAADPFGNVHVVWRDGLLSDLEIYYRKGN